MASQSQLNPAAQTGFSGAADYDTHRPSYPSSAVQSLLTSLRVADVPGARILDLASGTGKFTELLAKREEGYEIVAVEPHEGMRAELERKGLRGVEVMLGFAGEMKGVKAESVDAVVAAQAFHWFATRDSLEEIHRVLKEHGALGMIWNVEDYNQPQSWTPTTPWESKLKALIWSFDDNQPRFRHEQWRKVFDDAQLQSGPISVTTSSNPLFSLPIGESEESWEVWLSREEVWRRFRTLSQVAVLDGEELERTKKIFDEAINGEDVQVNEKGQVALHGKTVWAWTSKIPGSSNLLKDLYGAITGKKDFKDKSGT